MFNLGEFFLILRVEVPMADAPACESCLATYIVQGLLDHIEFILGGLMVGIHRFYLAFEACPGLHELPIRSLLLLKPDAQVSHSVVGACKFPSEVSLCSASVFYFGNCLGIIRFFGFVFGFGFCLGFRLGFYRIENLKEIYIAIERFSREKCGKMWGETDRR